MFAPKSPLKAFVKFYEYIQNILQIKWLQNWTLVWSNHVIINENLRLFPYRKTRIQVLTPPQSIKILQSCKKFLRWHSKKWVDINIFSKWKLFRLEKIYIAKNESYIQQSSSIYFKTFKLLSASQTRIILGLDYNVNVKFSLKLTHE